MEVGAAVHHGLGVLGNLVVEVQGGVVVIGLQSLHRAGIQTAAAAGTFIPVHMAQAVCDHRRPVGANPGAGAAADALFGIHHRAAGIVHIPFAPSGAGAHAQILQSATEAGLLVPLEVVQGDDDIRVHNGPADIGLFHIFAAVDGHGHIVGALQTVGNQHMGAGGVGGEAVEIGGFQMIQSILPGADVQCVGIGEEGLAPQILDDVNEDTGVAAAQVSHVPQLAEVNFDGHKLVLKINLVDSGGEDQPGQLLGQGFGCTGAEVGKVYLRGHGNYLLRFFF